MAKKVIVSYVPVIHRGYYRFLEANPSYNTLYILDREITDKYQYLQKEIRALHPHQTRQAIAAWNLVRHIRVAKKEDLKALALQEAHILMPDDDISHDLAQKFFTNTKVSFYPVFLRWDRRTAEEHQAITPDSIIAPSQFEHTCMNLANIEALRSSDIWRRVGALLAKDGEIINVAHNTNRPHEYGVLLDGDPRNIFSKGQAIEMSLFQHAESCVIADAAKKGIALNGADLFVTTFPCPPCAMLIAYSGISRLFFAEGYAVLEGERVLKERGVQIIRVATTLTDDHPQTFIQPVK